MTETAYSPLTIGENIFKSIVWDTVVNIELAALFSAYPWLSVWPLGPVIKWIVNSISNKTYAALTLAVDVEAIALVNAQYQAAYDRAAVTLKIIAHDKGIDSQEFKDARENAKKALSKYVSFGS